MTDDEKKALTLKARSAYIAQHYGAGCIGSATAGPAFVFEQVATPAVVLALLDELYEEQKMLRELRAELGDLYATIFRDGGHRQAELDALGPFTSADAARSFAGLFETNSVRRPRRYVEARAELLAMRARAERYDGLAK